MQQPSIKGLSIRLAHPREAIQCVRVQLDALRILCACDYSSEQLEALAEQKIRFAASPERHRELTWVAQQDGLVVGVAARLGCYITAVYVHPQCVRQGIGSQLLTTLETSARQEGLRTLVVNALLTARSFYQHHGYEILQESHLVTDSRVRIPVVKLQKSLLQVPSVERLSGE